MQCKHLIKAAEVLKETVTKKITQNLGKTSMKL